MSTTTATTLSSSKDEHQLTKEQVTLMKEFYSSIACDTCDQPHPTKRCSKCRYTYYCSIECQKQHWKLNHKKYCEPMDHYQNCYLDVTTVPLIGINPDHIHDLFIESTVRSSSHTSSDPNDITMHHVPMATCCSLCQQDPITNPINLPTCKHTFCYNCIIEWYKNYDPTWTCQQLSMKCPKCLISIDQSIIEIAIENTIISAFINSLLDNEYILATTRDMMNDHIETTGSSEYTANIFRTLELIHQILFHDDPNNIRALILKGQLIRNIFPLEAFDMLTKALDIDKVYCDRQLQISQIQQEIYMKQGNTTDNDKIKTLNELVEVQQKTIDYLPAGPFRQAQIWIWLAEACEAADDYPLALRHFKMLLDRVNTIDPMFLKNLEPSIYRAIHCGASRNFYRVQQYHDAIKCAKSVIQHNRHFPGVHKLLAQAQLKLHQYDDAIRTMQRGIIYEAPWDVKQQQRNFQFFDYILSECKKGSSNT